MSRPAASTGGLDLEGLLEVASHRLLHEERQPPLDDGQLRLAVGEDGQAEVDGVQIVALEHAAEVGEGLGAGAFRRLAGPGLVDVAHRRQAGFLHAGEPVHVAAGVAAAADEPDADGLLFLCHEARLRFAVPARRRPRGARRHGRRDDSGSPDPEKAGPGFRLPAGFRPRYTYEPVLV